MNKIKAFFKDKFNFKGKLNIKGKLNLKEKWVNRKFFRKKEGEKKIEGQSDEMMNLTEKLLKHKRKVLIKWGIIVGSIVLIVGGYAIYNHIRVFHHYSQLSSIEREDTSSTSYLQMNGKLLKYSQDGVSCVNSSNEAIWSTAFSMQSPIVDICGSTVVVADQKGTDIYIFDEDGLLGQFQTLLPILKVKVAKQGVVAAILEEGDVTWINFYDTSGNTIAKNRTTINDFGYPMDLDISPDGLKMMVSYLCATKGTMSTNVSFYNFGDVGKTQTDNMVNSVTYENVIVPKTLFVDDNTSIAVRDNGFTIFKGKQIPQESKTVDFTEEIISQFQNDKYLGFVMASDDPEHKYKMVLYKTSGSKSMEMYFDFEYKEILLDGDQMLMFNEGEFAIYTTGGKEYFNGTYDKPIVDIVRINGFRKYTIVTQTTTDQIRIN